MEQLEIVEILKNEIEPFAQFDNELLVSIVAQSNVASFEESEAIIEFGKPGRFLGVLLSGRVQVSCISDSGDSKVIAVFDGRGLFGEMALMTGQRTIADVIGQTTGVALLIPADVFASLIVRQPAALQYFVRLIAQRAKELDKEGNHRLMVQNAEVQNVDPYGFELQSDIPAKLLVINSGSSSLKYQLFDTDVPDYYFSGVVDQIGSSDATHRYRSADDSQVDKVACTDHLCAFEVMMQALLATGSIKQPSQVTAVGHRVVHGGELFASATVVDDAVIAQIEQLVSLAPLHNPVNLVGIRGAMKVFPDAVHVASFDTTFHHTLPPYAYLYGLPLKYYSSYGVRRYGFHGASHAYASLRAAQLLKRPYNELETIVCHLGNGSSLCAVDHGRSVDTSMGMTPTAGLPMGTRVGDLDPGALTYICREEQLDATALDDLINQQSGLLGLSGHSNDMRTLEDAAAKGDHACQLAIKTFCYQIRKYIGAYVAAMQGLDVLVFTGGIGQHSALVRALACQGLGCMGIELDAQKNQAASKSDIPAEISADNAAIKVLVIPANEELMIARQTLSALERARASFGVDIAQLEVPIEVSAHHVHLCQADVEALYGKGHQLTSVAPLSQPGQFACKEQVNLVGPKGRVERVRVLGPTRKNTQVEISMTEQFKLGIHPPIRESGDLEGTPSVILESQEARIEILNGVICAMRHIHMSPADALKIGVRDRYVVQVQVDGDRELTFGDVLVRVHPEYRLAMHIDTDEANAAHLGKGAVGHIVRIQSRDGTIP